jgi:predicted ATP-binding protein involved in virulence
MTFTKDNKALIRALQQKATKNDFVSAYQLSEYYLDDSIVTIDEVQSNKYKVQSEKYRVQALDIFKKQKLKVDNLSVESYRALTNLDIHKFNENMNVFIGDNGSGKTSVLDAISISLSWLKNRIVNSGGSGDSIDEEDISMGGDIDYASISSTFKLNKELQVDFSQVKKNKGSRSKKKSHIIDVTNIGNVYKESVEVNVGDKPRFNLPLLAYYKVNRSSDVTSKDITQFEDDISTIGANIFDGYKDSLNGKADFKYFFKWFKRLDDIEKHRKVNNPETSLDKNFIKNLEAMAKSDEAAKVLLQGIRDKDTREGSAEKVDDISKIKSIINDVVSLFMEGYENLEIQIEPNLAITIEKNNQKLNVLQLSQGEKTFLALILDITRRLIILNPSLPNPIKGAGVVLIDEFDLHLHPEWQRKIITGLPKVFENCQFFVTTHSPQVIGEVKPNQVFVLSQDENTLGYFHPEQSFGLSSNDILNELMLQKYSQLNRNVEVDIKLKEIFDLIDKENFPEALSKIAILEKELNGDIPELLSAKVEIELSSLDD